MTLCQAFDCRIDASAPGIAVMECCQTSSLRSRMLHCINLVLTILIQASKDCINTGLDASSQKQLSGPVFSKHSTHVKPLSTTALQFCLAMSPLLVPSH